MSNEQPDDDISATWRAIRAQRAEKRGDNREASARLLTQAGIGYTTANNGAHLIVRNGSFVVDFWPGTGKWRACLTITVALTHSLKQFLREQHHDF